MVSWRELFNCIGSQHFNEQQARDIILHYLHDELQISDAKISEIPESVIGFAKWRVEKVLDRVDIPDLDRDELVLRLKHQLFRCQTAGQHESNIHISVSAITTDLRL